MRSRAALYLFFSLTPRFSSLTAADLSFSLWFPSLCIFLGEFCSTPMQSRLMSGLLLGSVKWDSLILLIVLFPHLTRSKSFVNMIPRSKHSVHLQRRPNRKEYYSASCLSCTISTGGDWGYFHTCFSVAYKKTKTWLGDIRIQYICTASMCLYTDPSWLLSKDELSSEQRQHHSQQSDALEKRYK